MENLQHILETMHEKSLSKQGFIPLCIANMIICYKFAHNDEVYWLNFSRKSRDINIETMKDIYLFFIDFLPSISSSDESFGRKIEHLKGFDKFLSELFFVQKKYAKNPSLFEEHL